MPLVLERVEAVRESRSKSKRSATNKWADSPTWFAEDRVIQDKPIFSHSRSIIRERKIYTNCVILKKQLFVAIKYFKMEGEDSYLFGILNSSYAYGLDTNGMWSFKR